MLDVVTPRGERGGGGGGVTDRRAGVDIVLSDMAPNTSGVAERDHAIIVDLARSALEFAALTLRPGGVLQCIAVYCNVLQCVAVCCSVLQCVAKRDHAIIVDLARSALEFAALTLKPGGVLQCVAVC